MGSRTLVVLCSLFASTLLGCSAAPESRPKLSAIILPSYPALPDAPSRPVPASPPVAPTPPAPPPPPPIALPPLPIGPIPSTLYHAYGDSITAGSTLSAPTLAYPYLIALDNYLTLNDYAFPGHQACEVPAKQIFYHLDNPTAPYPLYTLMIGTNDADVKGAGPYEVTFNLCHQAAISWLAVPNTSKVLATGATVTSSGPGAVDPSGNWNAWHTATPGASVTFPILLGTTAPVYMWTRIIDSDPGAFTYAVDGATAGSFQTATATPISTQFGDMDSLALIRIPSVPAGAHTVTFTQTTAAGSMQIVGIGSPGAAGTPDLGQLPLVIVGEIPNQLQNSAAPCSVTPSDCAAYNADIQANVAIFQGDGLRVQYAENQTYMLGTDAEMDDVLHPSPLGQSELRQAFEALLPQ